MISFIIMMLLQLYAARFSWNPLSWCHIYIYSPPPAPHVPCYSSRPWNSTNSDIPPASGIIIDPLKLIPSLIMSPAGIRVRASSVWASTSLPHQERNPRFKEGTHAFRNEPTHQGRNSKQQESLDATVQHSGTPISGYQAPKPTLHYISNCTNTVSLNHGGWGKSSVSFL